MLELEARSPMGGSAGIQSSERLAEVAKRHVHTRFPSTRMHSVALGKRGIPAPTTKTRGRSGYGRAACNCG